MSECYNIVPWYNSEEWHRVYEDISNPSSSKEDALKLLLVWKARSPSLPSGIESTLSLLQVYVEDASASQDATNDQLLRLAYSSAIMRFVNHMLDTETVKGTSLYQAAKRLDVPDWIVDLRHDTAHSNTLPPITLLREACTISLQWLQTNYWDKHKEYIQDYVCGQNNSINGDAYKIGTLMNFCISLGICSHSKLKIKNLSEIPNLAMRESIVSDAKELLGDQIDLSNLKTVSIMSLVNILNTQGKKLLKVRDVSTVVTDVLLGDDSLFLSKELLYFFGANDFRYKSKLYISYVHCFEVLLTFLHTNDLLLDFILALIKITQNQEGGHFRAKLAALWLSQIFGALKISQNTIKKIKKMTDNDIISKKRKDLKNLYEHWYPGTSLKNLLVLDLQKPVPEELQCINYIQPIISTYNHYLSYFISNLLNLLVPKLPAEVAERICTLAKLISSPEKFPMTTSSVIYTAEDLQMGNDDIMIIEDVQQEDLENSEEKDNGKGQQFISNSIWKLASNDYDWSACPIGRVPWQNNTENVDEMEVN
ncbi:hypothetical protein PYW08_002674 [Mythimna loreyi]|uniref:Uncharacterized protein n=1 Tax=Mythimna loreyi TaxID=667449 RepID=A0ACC2QJ11_9NEOP|nr:hypothetical protein PYW08_002674 [Mythimna loreyi]